MRVDPNAVIAPPYDVVTATELDALLERSPYNAAHVESAPGPSETRYAEAAHTLHNWKAASILHRDEEPSYYVYEQRAQVEEETRTRRCFFARLRLVEPGTKSNDTPAAQVRPHEATMEGPRTERLALLTATRTHVSPIFAIFDDDSNGRAAKVLSTVASSEPDFEGTDALGDQHRLWVVNDVVTQRVLTDVLASSPVTIADGHHRYATALAYRDQQRHRHTTNRDDNDPSAFVLAGLVPASDPGIVVLPIHRLVKLPHLPENFLARLAELFLIEEMAPTDWDPAAVHRLWERVSLDNQGVLTFGMIGLADQRLHVLRARSRDAIDAIMPTHLSTASRHVDVLALTETVLRPLLGIDQATLAAGERVGFTENVGHAWEQVTNGPYQLAFLVNPTLVEQVLAVAEAGEYLPQKSTFFYPKLGTGLVLDSL